ncbi:MAG: hypothetical protein JRG97_09770 [Deltaproteobacteria bacterium]|nr:hypothetical protein [Deltaproteobacteria bacterium]MBW2051298.1 hypothetical protein [Deltaproteobacteria bacterium]MBW2141343.1 hypothetical protein [Deltaproteobacteria bacterium]MBW2322992.1 hypothetical protein [Deltaproteobacteria bacterium]
MLFVLNKLQNNIGELIQMLGGPEDKSLLLIGDAVNYGSPYMVEKLKPLFVEDIYVAGDALETRNVDLAPDCQVVDYDEIVSMIMDEDEKVLAI